MDLEVTNLSNDFDSISGENPLDIFTTNSSKIVVFWDMDNIKYRLPSKLTRQSACDAFNYHYKQIQKYFRAHTQATVKVLAYANDYTYEMLRLHDTCAKRIKFSCKDGQDVDDKLVEALEDLEEEGKTSTVVIMTNDVKLMRSFSTFKGNRFCVISQAAKNVSLADFDLVVPLCSVLEGLQPDVSDDFLKNAILSVCTFFTKNRICLHPALFYLISSFNESLCDYFKRNSNLMFEEKLTVIAFHQETLYGHIRCNADNFSKIPILRLLQFHNLFIVNQNSNLFDLIEIINRSFGVPFIDTNITSEFLSYILYLQSRNKMIPTRRCQLSKIDMADILGEYSLANDLYPIDEECEENLELASCGKPVKITVKILGLNYSYYSTVSYTQIINGCIFPRRRKAF